MCILCSKQEFNKLKKNNIDDEEVSTLIYNSKYKLIYIIDDFLTGIKQKYVHIKNSENIIYKCNFVKFITFCCSNFETHALLVLKMRQLVSLRICCEYISRLPKLISTYNIEFVCSNITKFPKCLELRYLKCNRTKFYKLPHLKLLETVDLYDTLFIELPYLKLKIMYFYNCHLLYVSYINYINYLNNFADVMLISEIRHYIINKFNNNRLKYIYYLLMNLKINKYLCQIILKFL